MLFSVVIAVRNEQRYMKQCLKGVFSQDINEDFEVFVVDGMSKDGTYELLKELQKTYAFHLLKNEKINAAAGRNRGIEQSKGELIAFVDADAIPKKDWLSNIKLVFDSHDETVAGVGGPDLLPENSSEKEECIGLVMTSPLARGGKLNPSTQHALSNEERSVGHIPTCNLCLRKSVLEEMKGFDEAFVKGQDLELNYRIKKAEYTLLYSPMVKVVHYRKDSFRSFARQIYKWAKAKVAIIKKHGIEGLVSHVYLWPLYAVFCLLAGLGLFWFVRLLPVFTWLFFLGCISYLGIVLGEATLLSLGNKKKKLFWYTLLLIPVVHIEYFFGVWNALLKRRIW
ncbi:MAG: glycosyltransferase [Candidatus Thermoplasmatota archaeon]|nr:glycosyltransferase [Candidatus Thermoplasmatota archaeon]